MRTNFWAGAVAMVMLATLTAVLVTMSGRSAWFVGVLVLIVYLMFATALSPAAKHKLIFVRRVAGIHHYRRLSSINSIR